MNILRIKDPTFIKQIWLIREDIMYKNNTLPYYK